MPEEIIKKFQDQYGKEKGKQIYYATANKQDRNPETFKKEEEEFNLDKVIDEEMANIHGVVADPNAPETPTPLDGPTSQLPMGEPSAVSLIVASPLPPSGVSHGTPQGLPETVPGVNVVPPVEENSTKLDEPPMTSKIPPQGNLPGASDPKDDGILTGVEKSPADVAIMEKKSKKEELKQVKAAGAGKDRKGNKHMPPAKKVEKDKKKYDRKTTDWKKFDESINLYLSKTSRNSDIGVNSLEKIWKECVEEQEKGQHVRSSRKFWLEVKTNFDRKVNDIFLQEAKKKMTERQKLGATIETFLEHIAKDRYVEAKETIKEMANSCVNSMISDRKVQYQKSLAEDIAKKVRETK
jgi:hypothetical protein